MALQSIYFDTVTFTIDTNDASCSTRGATLEADTPTETRNKLCGKGKSVGTPDWTLTVEYDQDWNDTTTSLSMFLFENAGAEADVELVWTEANTTATATVLITPGPFGGTAGEVAEGSVELPVQGQPTFAAIPVVPLGADAGATGAVDPAPVDPAPEVPADPDPVAV